MKQIFIFISLAVIGIGLYLRFFHDTPDEQVALNLFVSGFLMIVGVSSLLMNIFWNSKKKQKNVE